MRSAEVAILICVALLSGASARAHDPYEITSVVYLHSNRIELFLEMEFPTGMTLAGQKPLRDVAVLNQFEAALPQLRELASGFYEFTAGNHLVLPLRTNVELVVEDHIRFQVEFATTPYRPLRFVARGLGSTSDQNSYGTSLTVLDMVQQKVLGQTTLFAASAPAEFPPKNPAPPEAAVLPPVTEAPPPPEVKAAPTNAFGAIPASPAAGPRGESRLSPLVFLVGLAALILFFILRRRG